MNKHIRIWSFADVDRSGKVRWTANELGYEIEEVRIKPGDHKSDTYRQINPYEQVPTAEIDGEIFIESSAICVILAERHPEAGLIPVEQQARELFWQHVSVTSSSLEMPAVLYYLSKLGFQDSAWKELWGQSLPGRLDTLVQSIPADGHICGDFSVADICAAYTLRIGVQAGLLQLEGGLKDYFERLMERPAARASRIFDSLEDQK